MKKFLVKLVEFVAFPIIVIVIFELGIGFYKSEIFAPSTLDEVYADSHKEYYWTNLLNKDTLVLLTGSSSVRYGISCSILNSLSNKSVGYVNLAMNARDPIETYFILKHFNFKNVKDIYFGLDPWIYTKEYYRYRNSYMYMDFTFLEAMSYNFEYDRMTIYKRYAGFIKFLFPVKKNERVDLSPTVPDDFGSVKLNKVAKNFNDPVKQYFQLEKYGWSKLQFRYLKQIESLCRKNGIGFAVFIPPKRSDYSKSYKNECEEIHTQYLNNLEEVGFSAPIFGKYDQLDKLGDYKLFVEGYHLNSNGQKLYSELFFRLMKEKKQSFTKDYSWYLENNDLGKFIPAK